MATFSSECDAFVYKAKASPWYQIVLCSCNIVVESLWSPLVFLFYQIAIYLSATVNETWEINYRLIQCTLAKIIKIAFVEKLCYR